MSSHSLSTAAGLEVALLRAEELDEELIGCWLRFQKSNRDWVNPFFHPTFVGAVAAVRDDIRVAVLRKEGRTVGFFPFQEEGNHGRPLAHPISDAHDIIHEPGLRFDAGDLVRRCGHRSWSFDHVPASQRNLLPYRLAESESPCMDLAEGWEAYETKQKKRSTKVFGSTLRKGRKLDRDFGGLRLDFHTTDEAVFRTLLEWKTKQQETTGARVVLKLAWVVDLLEILRQTESGSFRGVLSALYAGNTLVAAHLGMQNADVLHMWMQTYNRDLRRYSPGLVMLTSLGAVAEEYDIKLIDLGKGPEGFKTSFRSDAIPLIEGSVDLALSRRIRNRSRFAAREWVRRSPFYPRALATKRFLRKQASRVMDCA